MNAWQEILVYLKGKVNLQSYQTWLRPTRFSHVDEAGLVVRVPNREFQDWIQEHYTSQINEALAKLPLGIEKVFYIVEEGSDKKARENGPGREVLQSKLDFDAVDHQLNPRYTFDTFVVGNCQPIRSCGGPSRGGNSRQGLQPAFPLRWCGVGKDALDAGRGPPD